MPGWVSSFVADINEIGIKYDKTKGGDKCITPVYI